MVRLPEKVCGVRCGNHDSGEVSGQADIGGKEPSKEGDPVGAEFGPGQHPARVLLKLDEGWTAPRVAAAMEVTERTVFRIKRRYVEEGLDETLHRRNQVNRHRKVDERVEAHLIALACSPAPEGHDHWELRLLADRMVELGLVESLSHETVRLHLKKTRLSRGRRSSGASPK